MLYAVRKRRGQWIVCSDEHVVLQFETYDEAISTARGAVEVLTARQVQVETQPDQVSNKRSRVTSSRC